MKSTHEERSDRELLRGSEVRIGIGCPLSGSSASLGAELKHAVELAIEEHDGHDGAAGLLGATLAATVMDDGSRADKAEALSRELCADESVLGIIGHYNSDVGLIASRVYWDCDLVMMNPIISNPGLTEHGYANVFRLTNRDDRTARAIAGYLARELGKRSAAVVATESTYGTSMASCFARAFEEVGGEVPFMQTCAEGTGDFSALVSALPERFDVLFYGGTFEGASLLRALRAAGKNQRFATGDGCWDIEHFLEPAGASAEQGEGVLVLSATPEMGRVPGARAFRERYERRYGPINNYAANAYDAARMLLAAIERAARIARALPTRRAVIEAMRSLSYQGIAYREPIVWDAHGDNVHAVTALHVADHGRFRQVAEIEAAA